MEINRTELKALLKELYKPSRFHDRETSSDFWSGYTDAVTETRAKELENKGYTIISHHDSIHNEVVKIMQDLSFKVGQRVERRKENGNLSHLF